MSKEKIQQKAINELNLVKGWCEHYAIIADRAIKSDAGDMYHHGYGDAANAILNIVKIELKDLEREKEEDAAQAIQRRCRTAVIFALISIFASFFTLMKAGM